MYWGQYKGYSDLTPDYDCSTSNGRTPTGCVAIAIAQVMRYYEHPSTYNWSSMKNSEGTMETSRLMKDAGNAVDTLWDCEYSAAKNSNVPSALKTTFGYSSASHQSFNSSKVESEIKAGFPVILNGGERKTSWIFFHSYVNGHAWVCDGTKATRAPAQITAGRWGTITICVKNQSFYMNWGWGSLCNGWYSGCW